MVLFNLKAISLAGNVFHLQLIFNFSLYQCLTLDVIGRCAFGLQTNAQTDKDDEFLNNIRVLFDGLSKTFIQPLVSKYHLLQRIQTWYKYLKTKLIAQFPVYSK